MPPVLAASPLTLYFIDVELGNAVLAVTPSGKAMLLDSGPEPYADRVLSVIKEAGVHQIDYAVISHFHWDHYGAIPRIAQAIPIVTYVDHGPDVELGRSFDFSQEYAASPSVSNFEPYEKVRSKAKHLVVVPGEKIALDGVELDIVMASGGTIHHPLAGAGAANAACAISPRRYDDVSEDAQSIGFVLKFGKFRFGDFGDLTWNVAHSLFCPVNKVGRVDLYLISHHGMSEDKEAIGDVDWARTCCSPAEVGGLHPRAAILSTGYDYVFRLGTSQAYRTVRRSPGLEDIWELNYQMQGGKEGNAPEKFVANHDHLNCPGHSIKVTAEQDGSFTVTNTGNGFSKRYGKSQ